MRRGGHTVALACALALVAAPAAHALSDCENASTPRDILTGQGTLESAIIDGRGHLYFTSSAAGGSLIKLRHEGAEPRPLVTGVASPGGLAFDDSGDLLMGYGDSILGGTTGTLDPQAGLLQINRRTGESELYADGLAMANGVARADDGTVFASDDVGIGIDRIAPDGTVENVWAEVISSNGMAVSPNQKWLYVAQTFQPAAVKRVLIDDPAQIENFFTAPPEDIAAGPDGMVRDRRGNIFVAANAYGELWRIDRKGIGCTVASGLGMASAVAIGHGNRNFKRRNLYVVDFDGRVIELANGTRARPAA
jgi:sugar lactone lactonase YvrE